jgi:hypothetical protein
MSFGGQNLKTEDKKIKMYGIIKRKKGKENEKRESQRVK